MEVTMKKLKTDKMWTTKDGHWVECETITQGGQLKIVKEKVYTDEDSYNNMKSLPKDVLFHTLELEAATYRMCPDSYKNCPKWLKRLFKEFGMIDYIKRRGIYK